MKTLVAVITCHAYRARASAIRATWSPDIKDADVFFFLGTGATPRLPDEIHLDVDDSYSQLPLKVQAMRRWALAQGYDYVLKVDDDVYLRPERLAASLVEGEDYRGRLRGPSGKYPAPYCSGFAYWLSAKAMTALVAIPWNQDAAEDRFTGNALLTAGFKATHERRFAVTQSKNNTLSFTEPPRNGNSVIASCEYEPQVMRAIHADFPHSRSAFKPMEISKGPFNKVAIMIKTFLRDGYLNCCYRGLQRKFPDAKLVIVDDGFESIEKIRAYADLRETGHECVWLPFDSGFGAKANEAIKYCDRDYVLIASDDFDFENPHVRPGIEKMLAVLEQDPEIDVASGRVNGHAYEGLLTFDGDHCYERGGYSGSRSLPDGTKYFLCDLTVNFSLIRRRVFDVVRWDDDVKIGGGEHGAFFIDLKRAGFKVCYVEGANINEYPPDQIQWRAPNYGTYRARARQPGRICFKRRGINFYHTFGGHIEET